MRVLLALALLLPACATTPRSPQEAQLDECLKQANRRIITAARLESGNRFSYDYQDSGGSGPEREKFVACMQKRTPAYPTVR